MPESSNASGKFIDLLKKSMKNSIELSTKIGFTSENPVHFTFICLYGSIIDITHGIVVSIKHDCYSSVQILLRSALETYVNVMLIDKDPAYVAALHHYFHKEWSKRIFSAENNNPYLKDMLNHSEFDRQKKELESRITEADLAKIKSLSIKDKFEICGMLEIYKSVYSFLSDHTHSNIGALINRHMKYVDGRIAIEFLKSTELNECDVYVSTFIELLLKSGIIVHRNFATSAEGALIANLSQLSDLIRDRSAGPI